MSLLRRDLFDAAKSQPVSTADGVFRRPATGGPDKNGGAQKTASSHGQTFFQPPPFTHLPDVAAHIIAAIGANPAVEESNIGGMLETVVL